MCVCCSICIQTLTSNLWFFKWCLACFPLWVSYYFIVLMKETLYSKCKIFFFREEYSEVFCCYGNECVKVKNLSVNVGKFHVSISLEYTQSMSPRVSKCVVYPAQCRRRRRWPRGRVTRCLASRTPRKAKWRSKFIIAQQFPSWPQTQHYTIQTCTHILAEQSLSQKLRLWRVLVRSIICLKKGWIEV